MKIYEYAILYKPSKDEEKEGKTAEIIVKPTTLVASNEAEATFKAARAVPEEYADRYDRLEVAVRPF